MDDFDGPDSAWIRYLPHHYQSFAGAELQECCKLRRAGSRSNLLLYLRKAGVKNFAEQRIIVNAVEKYLESIPPHVHENIVMLSPALTPPALSAAPSPSLDDLDHDSLRTLGFVLVEDRLPVGVLVSGRLLWRAPMIGAARNLSALARCSTTCREALQPDLVELRAHIVSRMRERVDDDKGSKLSDETLLLWRDILCG